MCQEKAKDNAVLVLLSFAAALRNNPGHDETREGFLEMQVSRLSDNGITSVHECNES
jgi:hypothetical protein